MNDLSVAYDQYIACEELALDVPTSTGLARRLEWDALPPDRSPAEDVVTVRNAKIYELLRPALIAGAEDEAFVTYSALENFPALLSLLPAEFPVAEPYVSHEGSICLDWYQDPENQISILLQDDNRIAYAAYFAGERVNGSADFSHGALPRELLEVADRWALAHRGR